VRVQILIAERFVDHIHDGFDIAFRLGALKDSSSPIGTNSSPVQIISKTASRRRHRATYSITG
jgi:hypothetical protein